MPLTGAEGLPSAAPYVGIKYATYSHGVTLPAYFSWAVYCFSHQKLGEQLSSLGLGKKDLLLLFQRAL